MPPLTGHGLNYFNRYVAPALDLQEADLGWLDNGGPALPAGWSASTCQALVNFLPEKLRCCEGLAMLRWSCCQCRCFQPLTRELQNEHLQSRSSLATRTLDVDVQVFWWHLAPELHDWSICEHKTKLINVITELCLEPPATTVLRRKGGRSGSFGFWLHRFAFRRRFFWLLVKFIVFSIFNTSYLLSEIVVFCKYVFDFFLSHLVHWK